MNKKERLDVALKNLCYTSSRSKAKYLITDNKVKINGEIINDPSFLIDPGSPGEIELLENFPVSRGFLKIESAIKHYGINLKDKIVSDIGSSTGGFAQCLLENNVKKIYCIDVGTDQFHENLKNDSRITLYEQTNFLTIDKHKIFDTNFFTVDVSFISIKKIVEKILSLGFKDFSCLMLFKPEFELGKELSNKHKGFVDPKYHKKLTGDFYSFLEQRNFRNIKMIESAIKGAKKKNTEFFFYCEHHE